MLSKRLRVSILVLGALGIIAAAVAVSGYMASRQVPEFYSEALHQAPDKAAADSDTLLANASALMNTARKPGQWEATFTADQINGWLAVDVPKNFPKLLPPTLTNPRVHLEPKAATVASQYTGSGLNTVISLTVDVYAAEPNVLALRIHNARAGALPVPLDQVLTTLTQAAKKAKLELRWEQLDGDPVALVTLPVAVDEKNTLYRLKQVELRSGSVYLSGETEEPAATATSLGEWPVALLQSAIHFKRQR